MINLPSIDYQDKKKLEENLFGRDAPKIDIPNWRTSLHGDDTHKSPKKRRSLTPAEEAHLFRRYDYARDCLEKLSAEKKYRRRSSIGREIAKWRKRVRTIRSDLVSANMPLVIEMAKRAKVPNVDFAEMISEGSMALLRAVDKFDITRGFKFSTYACRAIKHSFNRMATKTGKYRERYVIGLEPSMEKPDRQSEKHHCRTEESIDELRDILDENRANLSDTERTVIAERYGLGTGNPKTLAEVGKVINRSIERTRQNQISALNKIRELFS